MSKVECQNCELRYSSFCLGCENAIFGINGDKPTAEDILKTQKILNDIARERTERVNVSHGRALVNTREC